MIRGFSKSALFLVVAFLISVGISPSAKAEKMYLSQDEQDYIAGRAVLKAASIDGGAPLHYRNSLGEIKGIAVKVLDEIAAMTGLVIEYDLYDSIDEAANSGADIFFGVTKEYAPPGVILSKPYLETEAILYYNSRLDPKLLSGRRFAAIRGGTLPGWIEEEQHTIYFDNREEAINAVDRGEADYGYGNAYSLAFYALQNSYKNIVTVPTGKEDRAYCIGLAKEDDVLLSIINKSIEAMGESRIQTLILDVASQVEKKVTLPVIVDAYGKTILGIVIIVIAVLSFGFISNARLKNRFIMKNKIYKELSRISNEFLFEYVIDFGLVEISDKLVRIIDVQGKKELGNLLLDVLDRISDNNAHENTTTVELPFLDGRMGTFKIVSSRIRDDRGRLYSIVGKLIDITEEVAEKERLITQLQLDGQTGLYNATATKKMIVSSMKNRDKKKIDAFILLDCDNFKSINDTFGHLEGDRVIKNIARSLRLAFRETDIVGRIGGDEFCVYMHNISTADSARLKCQRLSELVDKLNFGLQITVSIGIAIIDGENTYNGLFEQADEALYLAKKKGGARIVVHKKNVSEANPDPG